MADPTVPWGIPLFDDNTPFAPIQAPFNAQSEALNDALSDGAFQPYATKALMDAAPGTRVGQHASVYADATSYNNGDYKWGGSVWVQTWASGSKSPFAVAVGAGSNATGSYATVTFPAGRFTVAPWVVATTNGGQPGTMNVGSVSATQMTIAAFGSSNTAIQANWYWTATQMTPTSASG